MYACKIFLLGYVCMEKLVSDVTPLVLLQTLIQRLCQKCRRKVEQICHVLVKPWPRSLVYAQLGCNAANSVMQQNLLILYVDVDRDQYFVFFIFYFLYFYGTSTLVHVAFRSSTLAIFLK